MSSVFNFIIQSGAVGWAILATGLFALALIVERVKVLYFDYGMNVSAFAAKIQSLVLAKKYDEAIVTSGKLEKKPLAKAFKTILEKSDRDDDAIYQAHDIAMAENVPLFAKRIHYLSMLANVATLLGLLGTIHGLILSFAAVANADPAQKQALLASGISVSMYTTALGLVVAIPVMIGYSLLVSRQNHLTEELMEKSSKLVEALVGDELQSYSRKDVFPDHLNTDDMPPASNVRAS